MAVYYSIIEFIETQILEDYADENDIIVGQTVADEAEYLVEKLKLGETIEIPVYAPGSAIDDESYKISNGELVIRVEEPRSFGDGHPYLGLFPIASRVPFIYDSPLIKSYAGDTARTRIEYIMLYTGTGEVYIFEGEYDRVSLPFVKVAFSLHTHPSLPGACALSRADIASGLDLLSVGGIGEAAATTHCAFIMYRRGLIDEDTYIAIKMLRRHVDRPGTMGRVNFEVISF